MYSLLNGLFLGPIELLELVHLNSETGEVVVSGKIDRERFAWINLTAKASDSGMPRRSSFVPVLIQVKIKTRRMSNKILAILDSFLNISPGLLIPCQSFFCRCWMKMTTIRNLSTFQEIFQFVKILHQVSGLKFVKCFSFSALF